MSSLEELRKKLVLQKETLEPVKKKERSNAGKKQVITEEQRQARSTMMKDPERLAKMQAGRMAAVEKKRAEKEEIQRLLKEEAMERLKNKIEKQAEREVSGKPSKAKVQDKLEELTSKLEEVPKQNTDLIERLNNQITQLNERMEKMTATPLPPPVVEKKEEPVKEAIPVPEPEPEKTYYYKPKAKTSLRKAYYDPYGLGI